MADLSNPGRLEQHLSYLRCDVNITTVHPRPPQIHCSTYQLQGNAQDRGRSYTAFECEFSEPGGPITLLVSPALDAPAPPAPAKPAPPAPAVKPAPTAKQPPPRGPSGEGFNKMVSVRTSAPFGRCDSAAFTRASRVLQQPRTNLVNQWCTLMYQYVLDLKKFILA